MPIHEADPWRQQYFEHVRCPASLSIPTDDALAFELNPGDRWIYDKLKVARSQHLPVVRPPRVCGHRSAPGWRSAWVGT